MSGNNPFCSCVQREHFQSALTKLCNTLVITTISLRHERDSTAVRLPFDRNSNALRPFDDLRYDDRPVCYGPK